MLKGKITNAKEEPLAFVNIFLKGTQIGTSSNELGNYELRLEPNTYEIVYQYVGYKQLVKEVVVSNADIILNVVLEQQNYLLNELSVNATAEDPAYPIIRQAMAYRNVYLNEAKEYNCRVYMKALQRLTTVPKKILMFKIDINLEPGIVYLSESVSDLSYKHPNKISEKVISSKVSGDNKAFSFNRAGSLKFSLYQPVIPSYGLNEHGFISPIAPNAFNYYKYKLEGEQIENGLTIYKIKIIPIKQHNPVFNGHIYIVKNSWRIHSTDLTLSKESQIEFVDNLIIKQSYAEQDNGVWMPVSQRFIFNLDIFGFKGNGYFVALYSNYKTVSNYGSGFYGKIKTKITDNENVPQVKNVETVKVVPQTTTETLFKPKHFTQEVLRIEPKANKVELALWDSLRPIPLTEEEISDYKEKDSIEVVVSAKHYQDSLDKITNKFLFNKFLLNGYTYANTHKKLLYNFQPFINMIQFNSVEGLVLNQDIKITKEFENEKQLTINPELRYGFSSKKFYGRLGSNYKYSLIHQGKVGFNVGSFVYDINNTNSIAPFVNTYYTLFNGRNYLKLYQESFASFFVEHELFNGFFAKSELKYARRSALMNSDNYTFYAEDNVWLTDNLPFNVNTLNNAFAANNLLLLNLVFKINFNQRYITRGNVRYRYRSNYPTVYVHVNNAFKTATTPVKFTEVNVSLNHYVKVKMLGTFIYKLKAGTFLNKPNYLIDFHHFAANQVVFELNEFRGFQLLPYYRYSTNSSFIETHFSHHFNGLFFNKIEPIRKFKLQEVVGARYLKTVESPNIIEASVGIEHIFKIVRIDYNQQYLNGVFTAHGFRIGIGF